MSSSPFLPLPAGLEITTIETVDDLLVVHVVSTRTRSHCPLCFCPAQRQHSQYTRVVADLPCAGLRVQLRLQMHKFFCENADCSRKIFTERVPAFVEPWAQTTVRLRQALQAVGTATCGELGTRLATRLGIGTSAPTILRRLMALPSAPVEAVSHLGIDDFGATRSYKCSCKDSRKEDLTWSSASSAEPSLNQVRLGQCSHVLLDGDEPARHHHDC